MMRDDVIGVDFKSNFLSLHPPPVLSENTANFPDGDIAIDSTYAAPIELPEPSA
jgi:hypothetical protein